MLSKAFLSPLYPASKQLSISNNKLPYQQRSWQPNRKSTSKSGWQRGPGRPGGSHHPGRGDDDRHGGRGDGQLWLLVLGGRGWRRRGKSAHTGIKFWYYEKIKKKFWRISHFLTLHTKQFQKKRKFLCKFCGILTIYELCTSTFKLAQSLHLKGFASNYPTLWSRSFLIFSF